MDIFSLFTLCGGLAFFLYGMNVMSKSLEKMAGGKLERLLKKMTSSPIKSLLLGAGITIAIQSSSAMTVMLVGLVGTTGIVMVDFTNLLRERGVAMYDAVYAAGKSRLRPVLMTSLTTILGMLPLAIGLGNGAEMWQPMGIAIIGGLTFSTVLTLVAVPVLYYVFMGRSERYVARRKERKERKAQEKLAAIAERERNEQ